MKTLVFPTDFSERANAGLSQVADFCLKIGAKLIVYHVYTRPYTENGSKAQLDKLLRENERSIEDLMPT